MTMTYKDFLDLSGVPYVDTYDVAKFFWNSGPRGKQFPEASILEEGSDTPLELDDDVWEQLRIEFEEKFLYL